jgi:hypothetical protein
MNKNIKAGNIAHQDISDDSSQRATCIVVVRMSANRYTQ